MSPEDRAAKMERSLNRTTRISMWFANTAMIMWMAGVALIVIPICGCCGWAFIEDMIK